jgi:hypothetical protein
VDCAVVEPVSLATCLMLGDNSKNCSTHDTREGKSSILRTEIVVLTVSGKPSKKKSLINDSGILTRSANSVEASWH